MNPLSPDFWEQYNKFMENTFKNTQRLMNDLGGRSEVFSAGGSANIADGSWTAERGPEIKIDDNYVYVTLATPGKTVDNVNTRIALEGYKLIIDGAHTAQVSLPVAVLKYGGKAVSRGNTLEVKLLRDKYNTRTAIPIEKEI